MSENRKWMEELCTQHEDGARHRRDCIHCLRDRLDYLERWKAMAHEMHPAHAENVNRKFLRS
jgi:hypothetical protein